MSSELGAIHYLKYLQLLILVILLNGNKLMNKIINGSSNIKSIIIATIFYIFNIILHAIIILLAWNYISNSIDSLKLIGELSLFQAILIRALILSAFYPNMIRLDND